MITKCKSKPCAHSQAWAGPAGSHPSCTGIGAPGISGNAACSEALLQCFPRLCLQISGVQAQRMSQGPPLHSARTEVQWHQCPLTSKEVLQTHLLINFSPSRWFILNLPEQFSWFCSVFLYFFKSKTKLVFIYRLVASRVVSAPECKQSHMSWRQFCGICHPIKQSTTRLGILKRQL